jgi:hypothetical protein
LQLAHSTLQERKHNSIGSTHSLLVMYMDDNEKERKKKNPAGAAAGETS